MNCFSEIISSSLSLSLYVSRHKNTSLEEEAINCLSSIGGNLAENLENNIALFFY